MNTKIYKIVGLNILAGVSVAAGRALWDDVLHDKVVGIIRKHTKKYKEKKKVIKVNFKKGLSQ